MRIEVRKSDAFTMGGGSLFFYREGACYAIRTNGSVDIVPYERTSNEYDIPHALAFELMKCMGHDPVYVDEAVPVPSPDPHAEWREAVTEWVQEWNKTFNVSDTWPTLARLTTRVIEAAERAKKEAGR